MKRKIFSKLLMVALVIAAVGSFVSCKDYDDDINNLQKQIDNAALKSSVEALEKTLNDKIAAAQSAAQAAQTAADKAATTANAAVTKAQLDDAISAAKTAAATAANEYADKVATAAQTAAAKEAYDQAKAYTDAEVAKVTAAIPSEDAIKAIAAAAAAELDGKLATDLKTWVNEQIDAIDVEGQVEAAVAKAIEKIDAAAANVAAIWSAATSVDLYDDPSGVLRNILDFRYGTVAVTEKFGDESYADVEEKSYKTGDEIKFNNELLVRVNPVNAEITADQIVLINSLKKQSLADFIEIGTPVRYNELITRAGDVNTGLWRIPITLKEGVDNEDVEDALVYGGDKVLFAIAINNTADADADRYVASAFELEGLCGEYKPVNTFDVLVNGKSINDIKNRWDGNIVKAEDGTTTSKNPEYAWKKSTTTIPTPAAEAAIVTTGTGANVELGTVANKEARYAKDMLAVKDGDEIVLSFAALNDYNIEAYYVVFDKDNAIESAPSEWNAWKKYQVEGLGEIKKANQKISIKIPEGVGDVIGFRVYAVNYDGTLADPDGRAFYIQYGEPAAVTSATAAGNVIINKANATLATANNVAIYNAKDNVSGAIAVTAPADGFEYLTITPANNVNGIVTFTAADAKKPNIDDAGYVKNDYEGKIKQSNGAANTVTLHYVLLKADHKIANNWNEVAEVAVQVDRGDLWVDNSTLTFDIIGKDATANNRELNKLTVSVTKELVSTKPTNWSWKATQGPDANNLLTLFMLPSVSAGIPAAEGSWGTWTGGGADKEKQATYGTKDLKSIVNLPTDGTDKDFEFTFAAASKTPKSGKYQNVVVTFDNTVTASELLGKGGLLTLDGSDASTATPFYSRVGDGNTYATTLGYNYGEFEVGYDDTEKVLNNRYVVEKHVVNAWSGNTKFSYIYSPDVLKISWPTYYYAVAEDANNIATLKSSSDYYIQWDGVSATILPVYGNVAGLATGAPGEINLSGKNDFSDDFNPTAKAFYDGASAVPNLAAAGLDITKFVRVKSDLYSAFAWDAGVYAAINAGPTLSDGISKLWQFNKAGVNYWYGADFKSNSTSVEDYFHATVDGTFKLSLAPIATAAAPTAPVASTIEIKAVDVFGHKVTIAKLPIVLKN